MEALKEYTYNLFHVIGEDRPRVVRRSHLSSQMYYRQLLLQEGLVKSVIVVPIENMPSVPPSEIRRVAREMGPLAPKFVLLETKEDDGDMTRDWKRLVGTAHDRVEAYRRAAEKFAVSFESRRTNLPAWDAAVELIKSMALTLLQTPVRYDPNIGFDQKLCNQVGAELQASEKLASDSTCWALWTVWNRGLKDLENDIDSGLAVADEEEQ